MRYRKLLPAVASSLLLLANTAQATFITGSGDPDYDTSVQGASAHTFDNLGYSVGTGPGQLHVSLGTWTDPAGLIFGTLTNNSSVLGSGTTTNKLTDSLALIGLGLAGLCSVRRRKAN